MDIVHRLKNRIFKRYLSATIEYHAGGFFIHKRAEYLIFKETNVLFFEREEGTHPNDNNYQLLVQGLEQKIHRVLTFEISATSDNILTVTSESGNVVKIMPSIFIENVVHDNLTEILLDKGNGNTNIYSYVYSVPT